MAKGKVYFEVDKCKGCSLCIEVCPSKILYLDMTKTNNKGYTPISVSDMDKCIGCALCARMCPDSIISVERFSKEETL